MTPRRLYKNSILSFFGKLVLVYFIIYIGFSFGYGFFGPREFSYRNSNAVHQTASMLTQPITEVAANGYMNRWYNWNLVSRDSLQTSMNSNSSASSDIRFTSIQPIEQGNIDFSKDISFANVSVIFSDKTPAAVIQPKEYSGKWSLIFCQYDICKESNLLVKNEVKILLTGNMEILGRTEDGRLVQLEVFDFIHRSDRMDLDLI